MATKVELMKQLVRPVLLLEEVIVAALVKEVVAKLVAGYHSRLVVQLLTVVAVETSVEVQVIRVVILGADFVKETGLALVILELLAKAAGPELWPFVKGPGKLQLEPSFVKLNSTAALFVEELSAVQKELQLKKTQA